MDDRATLLLLSDAVGSLFGSEDLCIFLHSLIRMQVPHTIVELGTGLRNSAFWMALAAKCNGVGHVWSVDDLSTFKRHDTLLAKVIDDLQKVQFASLEASTPQQYFQDITKVMDLDEFLTFIHEQIDLNERGHFDRYPFGNTAQLSMCMFSCEQKKGTRQRRDTIPFLFLQFYLG